MGRGHPDGLRVTVVYAHTIKEDQRLLHESSINSQALDRNSRNPGLSLFECPETSMFPVAAVYRSNPDQT